MRGREGDRFGRAAATAALLLMLAAGGALAAEPPFHDCLEGAGDDLGSVSLDDLVHGPPPPPASS